LTRRISETTFISSVQYQNVGKPFNLKDSQNQLR